MQSNSKPDQGSLIVRIKDDPASSEKEVLLEIPRQLVYSVCFDPEYRNNGVVYVFTNGPRDAAERMNRVSRYTVARQPLRIDPKSETPRDRMEIGRARRRRHDVRARRHVLHHHRRRHQRLRRLGFGPDFERPARQRPAHRRPSPERLAALRHPQGQPVREHAGRRPEIWAYGLRNPWRMCTDAKTGHIWVGNNGQDLWETAYLLRRGANYGWSVYEGSHPFYLERKRGPTPLVLPTIEHSHAEFRSLTGGVVYYGKLLPRPGGRLHLRRQLERPHLGNEARRQAQCSGTESWPTRSCRSRRSRSTVAASCSIADYAGGINRLVPRPKEKHAAAFPTLLSQTGLFTSTSPYQLNPSLDSLFRQRARLGRWSATPSASSPCRETRKSPSAPRARGVFPTGRRSFRPSRSTVRPETRDQRFRVETRVLLRQQGEWAGYSYRWNSEQTDASLVAKNGEDTELDLGTPTERRGGQNRGNGDSPAGPSAWPATAGPRTSSWASPDHN